MSKWRWFWKAKFDPPKHDKIYEVESLEGFLTPAIAEAYFRTSCENGYLAAQGVPVGSVSLGVEYILKEVKDESSNYN